MIIIIITNTIITLSSRRVPTTTYQVGPHNHRDGTSIRRTIDSTFHDVVVRKVGQPLGCPIDSRSPPDNWSKRWTWIRPRAFKRTVWRRGVAVGVDVERNSTVAPRVVGSVKGAKPTAWREEEGGYVVNVLQSYAQHTNRGSTRTKARMSSACPHQMERLRPTIVGHGSTTNYTKPKIKLQMGSEYTGWWLTRTLTTDLRYGSKISEMDFFFRQATRSSGLAVGGQPIFSA